MMTGFQAVEKARELWGDHALAWRSWASPEIPVYHVGRVATFKKGEGAKKFQILVVFGTGLGWDEAFGEARSVDMQAALKELF